MTGSLIRFALTAALALPLAMPTVAFGAEAPLEMSVGELTSAHSSLDGSLVTFAGEAIGEALGSHRDWKWVNVLGEGAAVGVVVQAAWVERIDRFGDYHNNGTRVQVTGTLNIACDEHGGDFDVHATSFEVIEKGSDREHEFQPERIVWALGLGVVAVVLAVVYGQAKRRRL